MLALATLCSAGLPASAGAAVGPAGRTITVQLPAAGGVVVARVALGGATSCRFTSRSTVRGFDGSAPCRGKSIRRIARIGRNPSRTTRDIVLTIVVRGRRPAVYRWLVHQAGAHPAGTVMGQATVRATVAGAAPGAYTFDDEFSGPAGAGPNEGLGATVWNNDPCWQDGCGNNSPTENSLSKAYLDGEGHLVLEADRGAEANCGSVPCGYTSARLTMLDWRDGGKASFSQTYGTFAARIKAPAGQGLWPAFWLAGTACAVRPWPGCGEIDVMEGDGNTPYGVGQYAHGSTTNFGAFEDIPASGRATDWHTYSVTWSPSGLVWKIDGQTTMMLSAAEAGPGWSASFEHPFAVILDLCVGGDSPGPPSATTAFPAKLHVDWVRVTSR